MPRDTRETLDNKIKELNDSILELGSIVEQAVLGCVDALVERDLESARNIYHADKHINEKRYEIERKALITVATQQPMATDLRRLSSIIDIAGELERIGDYAKGIARIAMRLGDQPQLMELVEIPKMGQLTANMLHRALGAFVEMDEEKAEVLLEKIQSDADESAESEQAKVVTESVETTSQAATAPDETPVVKKAVKKKAVKKKTVKKKAVKKKTVKKKAAKKEAK